MKKYDIFGPIIQHRTDTDFYKKTMQQFYFHNCPSIEVTFGFKNRTKNVKLGREISEKEMREELDYAWALMHEEEEISYLASLTNENGRIFKDDYLEFLRTAKNPPYDLKWGDDFELTCTGPLPLVTDCEIFPMSITTELYGRAQLAEQGLTEEYAWWHGQLKLLNKLDMIGENPFVYFSDFGTRRRHSRRRHEDIVLTCAEELPKQFLGTSNVYFTMKHGLKPIGTIGHETLMIDAGLADSDEEVRESQNNVVRKWYKEYGYPLSIALVDTFSSNAFYKYAPKEFGKICKGVRPDSGDPIEEGEKAIAWYKSCGVDPREKFNVPSDGLTAETMVRIARHFLNRINTSAGWGTNLTNDFGNKNISIVMKALIANGRNLAKLTNNIAKATGDPMVVKRLKKIFGYSETYNATCVY